MSKKYYLFAAAALMAVSAVAAPKQLLKVYDVGVDVREDAKIVDVDIQLYLKDFKINRNGEAIFTPIIISDTGNDSIVMEPITVCGRNRWYWYMRNGMLENPKNDIYRAGSDVTVEIERHISMQPWMNHCYVEMRQEAGNCCAIPTLVQGDSQFGNVLIAEIDMQRPNLNYEYVFAPPVDAGPVQKAIEGRAFVTFVVNRTELKPDYMVNPRELKKITNSIDLVKRDPDAEITEVHIRGYASPEGPWDNNVRLAKGRTATLANYVAKLYKFPAGMVTTSYDPEDWVGLRSYVTDSMNYNIQNRQAILDIIDGPLGADARDAALKERFPQDYEVMYKQIYPWLRHSDYTVKYNIKIYTDINELMRLYNSDPSKLRAVDFYTIAQQYPAGSPEYMKIMQTAIEVYPDEPMINLNMANLYMQEGDFEKAQSCLLKANRTPEADFARGVLAAKRGDFKEAQKYFEIADQAGIPQAKNYLNQLATSKALHPVTIHVKTTKK